MGGHWEGEAMRSILTCLLPLVLCSCFTSETPRIPEKELSLPKDFSGTFWSISQYEQLEAKAVEIRPEGAGVLAFIDKDPGQFRLVEVLGAGVYLLISDVRGGLSTYYLLQRRDAGIWELDNIGVTDGSPFAEQNLAYLDTVAGDHGLSLDDDMIDTGIEGDVHGMAIPGLFRDRRWLAALEIQPMSFYLPKKAPKPSSSAIALPDNDRTGALLFVNSPPPVGDDVFCATDFAGRYSDRAAYSDDYRPVVVHAQAGCRYRVERADGSAFMLTLLPYAPDEGTYIGIEQWSEPGDAWHGYVWIVEKYADNWTFFQVTRSPNSLNEHLDALRDRAMAEAAARYGLVLSGAILAPDSGELKAASLRDLLHDGQFTSGLAVLPEPGRLFERSAP